MLLFGFSVTIPLKECRIIRESFGKYADIYGVRVPEHVNDVNFPIAPFHRWLRDWVRFPLLGVLHTHYVKRFWVWPMTTNGKLELCFLGSMYRHADENEVHSFKRKIFPGGLFRIKNHSQPEMYRKLRVYLKKITKAQFNKFNVIVGNRLPL